MGIIRDRGHDGGNDYRWTTIERFVKANGWTTGAELGVWEGETYRHLIAHCPDLTLIGVDLYAAQPDNTGPEKWTPGENGHAWDHERYHQRILAFCAAHQPRAIFHRGYTHEVAERIADASLDFVFIDADHSFDGVRRDIDAWAPKVRPGGYVMGHDIHFDTVRAAVELRYGDAYRTADDFLWYHVKT